MKTLILGLGNPILSDDGVGWEVAQGVYARAAAKVAGSADQVELVQGAVAGLTLVSLLSGYDRAIIIDAICTRSHEPGTCLCLGLDDLESTPRLSSPHDVHLWQAIEVGKSLGHPVPREVRVYAIEVQDPYTFGENLTPAVAQAVPGIVDRVVAAEFA